MEMPEGFIELKKLIKGAYGFPCRPKVEIALILMKEMAEALDTLVRSGFRPDQQNEAKQALNALRNFEEWK